MGTLSHFLPMKLLGPTCMVTPGTAAADADKMKSRVKLIHQALDADPDPAQEIHEDIRERTEPGFIGTRTAGVVARNRGVGPLYHYAGLD